MEKIINISLIILKNMKKRISMDDVFQKKNSEKLTRGEHPELSNKMEPIEWRSCKLKK